jgi:hypothetical protein
MVLVEVEDSHQSLINRLEERLHLFQVSGLGYRV